MEITEKLQSTLRRVMSDKLWTQRQLGEELDVSEGTISRWLTSEWVGKELRGPHVQRIADLIAEYDGEEEPDSDDLTADAIAIAREWQLLPYREAIRFRDELHERATFIA